MTWLVVAAAIVLALLVLVFAVVGAWAYRTAHRLDRLNVRYDLSWQALDGALARRAVVARAVAIDAYGGGPGAAGRLAALADAAENAPRHARETAENELSAALAMVDPASLPAGLIAELADAEARVVLARRFHNDAVRDTLALAERRMVRAFRLGGTAALPSYFEIVERPHALAHGDHGVLNHRTSARVVLLDDTGAVLLLCGSDPAITDLERHRAQVVVHRRRRSAAGRAVGRGRRAGAGRRDRPAGHAGRHGRTHLAARRGFRVQRLTDRQRGVLPRPPNPAVRAVLARAEPSWNAATSTAIAGVTAADIAALVAGGETVYPMQLSELLSQATALADNPAGGRQAALQSIR